MRINEKNFEHFHVIKIGVWYGFVFFLPMNELEKLSQSVLSHVRKKFLAKFCFFALYIVSKPLDKERHYVVENIPTIQMFALNASIKWGRNLDDLG